MRSRLPMFVCAAVALATAACGTSNTKPITPSGAQNYPAGPGPTAYVADVNGTVTRVDMPSSVIVLDNGQMYQVAGLTPSSTSTASRLPSAGFTRATASCCTRGSP